MTAPAPERCPKCQANLSHHCEGGTVFYECGSKHDPSAGFFQWHGCQIRCCAAEYVRLSHQNWTISGERDEAIAERDAALKRAELLDFMRDFQVLPQPVPKHWLLSRLEAWSVITLNKLILDYAKKHGPWETAEAALAACRDWVLSPEGTGWANRRTKGETT